MKNDPLITALAGAIVTQLAEPQDDDREPMEVTEAEVIAAIAGLSHVPSDFFWTAFDSEVHDLTGRFIDVDRTLTDRDWKGKGWV